MSKREENRKRLAEFGFQLDSEPLPSDPAPEPSPEPTDPDPNPEPSPEPPKPEPTKSPDGHDWEKRKADAQEAQRALSRQERAVEEKIRLADAKLAEVDEKVKALERLAALTHRPEPSSTEDASEFDQEYPELSVEVTRKARAEYEKLRAEDREREQLAVEAKANEQKRLKEKSDSILQAVFEARPDAADVANSAPFQDWLDSLPTRLSAKYRDYIEHTAAYSAQDALDVLDLYDQSGGKTKTTVREPDLDAELPRGNEPPKGPNQMNIRRLTAPELASINTLMRGAKTQAERDIWSKRLRFHYENPIER